MFSTSYRPLVHRARVLIPLLIAYAATAAKVAVAAADGQLEVTILDSDSRRPIPARNRRLRGDR